MKSRVLMLLRAPELKIRVLMLQRLLALKRRALRLLRVPELKGRATRLLLAPGPKSGALELLRLPELKRRVLMFLRVPEMKRRVLMLRRLLEVKRRALTLLRVPEMKSRVLMLRLLLEAERLALMSLRVPELNIRALMLLLVPALIAAAQSPIGYPRVGCFRDDAGSLRPVLGIAGTFVLGDAERAGVIAAACRGRLTLIKTEDALELLDRDSGRALKWPAPAGPALFAFPADGSAPAVFFPATSDWVRAAEGASPRAFPAIEAEVLAVWSDGARATFVVRREPGLFLVKVSLAWGYVVEETKMEGVRAPALLARDGTLLASDGAGLVVRAPDREERRIALPAPPAAIEQLGEGWVRIALEGGAHMALRLFPGGEELYHLPEAAR